MRSVGTKRTVVAIVCLLYGGLAAQQKDQSIDFIQLSDTHVVDLHGVAPALFKARQHLAGAERRLAAFLAQPPVAASFVLITGDLTDAFRFTAPDGGVVGGQTEAFRRAVAQTRIPLYLTLGNHDIEQYRVAPDGIKAAGDQWLAGAARAYWTRTMECFGKGTYYEFAKQVGRTRYVFLMLDDGYVATGSIEHPAVTIAHEQLYWLRKRAEANAGAVLVLAMHIPIGTNANSQAIRQAVESAPNVALVLVGHNHRDQIDDLDLGASRAVQVRTAALGYGAGNWRRIRLLEGRIEVYETGSKTKVVRSIRLSAVAKRPAA
ncbi:MAG TPA: metallophosphoesterase [Bryobacteraceae bacterium]|nr:metallophosphoesterase [Bryobacteraceae bacterium]